MRLAWVKRYHIDEFEYGHGSWLVAQGLVPYRDFFEHHFPLIDQLMAVPWLLAGDDPENLRLLRLAMLPFLALTLLAAAALNRRLGAAALWATPVVVLATVSFVQFGGEVRPDPIAFACFLAALAALAAPWGPRWRGFLAGALLMVALWGSQKVLYYGLIFPAALAVDLLRARRPAETQEGGRRYLLGHPGAFVLGGAAVLLAIAAYLTATGSWGDWFSWSVRWSFVHQLHYPGFPWSRHFLAFLAVHLWLFPLAVVGVAETVRRLDGGGEAWGSPDLLLLGALLSTFLSYVWQTAPYPYSLLPFMGLLAVFAARGLTVTWRWLVAHRRRWPAAAGLGLALFALLAVGELLHVRTLYAKQLLRTNRTQHELLRRVGELAEPGEPVYDNAGRAVTRPSVHYFFFAEAVVQKRMGERLAREIPRAVLEKGATVFLEDGRSNTLPEAVQGFLRSHFRPYDVQPVARVRIHLWGRRYEPSSEGELAGDFQAARAGRHFVEPASVLEEGELEIGGTRITEPVFELEGGLHPVRYRGPARPFHILWLPPDGRRWRPGG